MLRSFGPITHVSFNRLIEMTKTRIQIGLYLVCAWIMHFTVVVADEETENQQRKLKTSMIRFNRDVRPILSDRCFVCHGPDGSGDESKASSLRLDDRESGIDHGIFDFDAIEESELLLRINSDDPDLMMPPPDSDKKPLSGEETKLVTRWVQEGAQYSKHWAYLPPQRPTVPEVEQKEGIYNPIDSFVIRRLEELNRRPASSATRDVLIRRVTYDLTGMPPSIAEIDAFEQDSNPVDEAYETVVDRLLQSPHYGEHMARFWLDAARYADTSGYQYDRERQQWVWRDWVIHAFNSNMPFDKFTIQQIAGDLLPNATEHQRLATGFNRNHPITIEGGVVDEEYRNEYVIDRVVTTSTVWLGQTFLCARCHNHKYDPVSQENFYQFYSFFNNVPERGLHGFDPKLQIASPLDQRIRRLNTQVDEAESELTKLDLPFSDWERTLRSELPEWIPAVPDLVSSSGGAIPIKLDDNSVLMSGDNPETDDYEVQFKPNHPIQAIRLEALVDPSLTAGSASRGSNGNFVLSEFEVEALIAPGKEFTNFAVQNAVADYEQSGYTVDYAHDGKVDRGGWAVDGNTKPANRMATFNLVQAIPAGATLRIILRHRYGLSHQIGRFRLAFSEKPSLSRDAETLLQADPKKRSAKQEFSLREFLVSRFGDAASREAYQKIETLRNELKKASTLPATMVMSEMPEPRKAFVLERGEYDKPIHDRPVSPGVPESIGSLPDDAPQNRLGLAQWLIAPDQPLTARVTVNRFWQRLFGVGLVKTSEDFGSQGEYPSHPDLLDWLAVEFMDNGWDIQHILKQIVLSNTYRQSSFLDDESEQLDPENRLLARGPRFRLDGEAIRDTALKVSGLLDATVGGPSVYPYHPNGLWLEINNRPNYSRPYPHQKESAHNHRRTLYTFWKRTVPPPSVATFDAPSREYCVVRRSSTNTPLQAFVMLHDPQFIEAARHLGMRMLREGGETIESQIKFGFRCCTSRNATDQELDVLLDAYSDRIEEYRKKPDRANQVLSVGISGIDETYDRAELATMTHVARMLMNLSEFLTKG